ncbi:MAG: asparagine synthase C-terminal domain-containing protein [Phycisphaerae bacterium]|jgi:asparagine synthetase B (glutamine-hydrolysing)
MFVIALTLTERRVDLAGLRTTTRPCGGGHLLTAANDLLGVERVADGVAEVGESLPARAGAARYWLVRARVDLATGEATVRRRLNSGRHVYYVERFGEVFIASHIKLLKQLGVPIEENERKLPELFQYRYAMPGSTLLKGVRQLQADEEITVTRGPRGWSVRTTGVFSPPEPEASTRGDLVADCRAALESVHDEANLDQSRFAPLLSGGLDSSILTRIASQRMGSTRSWSCAYPFEDSSDDLEYTYATTAAKSLGLSHVVHVPTMASYLRSLVDCIWHAEQPVIHLQTVLLYCIFRDRLSPAGVDVVSCGEGADGMFGFRFHRFLNHLLQHPAQRWALGCPPIRWQLRVAARRLNRFGLVAEMAGRKFDPTTPLDDPDHILWSLAMFGHEPWIRKTFGCTRREITQGRAQGMQAYAGRSLLDAVSILGFLSEGTETQVVWSLVGEGAGVSVFYPYPNERLIDRAYRIPWTQKLLEPKAALRDVGRSLGIEESIITRPKAAFGIRSERYGPRNSVLEPLVTVAAKGIDEQLLRSLQSPEIYHSQMLFTALNLGIWRRLFINGDSVETVREDVNRAMHDLGCRERFESEQRVSPVIR